MKRRVRINRYLSLCGLGSRRKVEDYIRGGRIKINSKVEKDLSRAIDIDDDIVELDNKRLYHIKEFYYIILNKPKGYITSMSDERGRPIVMDIIPEKYKNARVFPVGRLDKDTEGLLLLTNNGDMAYKLSHPKFGIIKEYIVELDKPLKNSDKSGIEKGIYLYGKRTNPLEIDFLDEYNRVVRITMHEGRKRQIRLTFKRFGYKVIELKRIAYGQLRLNGIKTGAFKILKRKEIEALSKSIRNRT